MGSGRRDIPPEFAEIASALEAARPELGALELDRVKLRALAPSAPPARREGPMGSRLTIVALLVSGLVLSGGGASLGVSALTSTDNASVAQYGTTTTPPPTATVPPPGATPTAPGRAQTPPTTTDEDQEVLGGAPRSGVGGGSPTPSPAAVQPARQVEQGTGESAGLPFTGYAAIPVLLAGLALLGTGLVLRRRTLSADG